MNASGGVGDTRVHRSVEVLQVRLLGDDANGTTHGPRTVQCALRTAKHFDVIDVEYSRIQRVRQRRFVKVEASHIAAAHAANRDRSCSADAVSGWSEPKVWDFRPVVEKVADRL